MPETMTLKTFADAEKVLAQTLPGYESRPQQQALAQAIEETLAATPGAILVAEAGCGTGKSIAGMVPAILAGGRVIVSTATKALMDQYAQKDVPFLQEHLPVPFTWTLLKGRGNYVCLAKLNDADSIKVPFASAVRAELDANEDHDGDMENMPVIPSDRRFLLSTSGQDCAGKDCPFVKECYSQKAKERAKASNIVITNHAMLMTDLKVRQMTGGIVQMLDEYDAVLFDEAHELEEYATNQLRDEIRETQIPRLVSDIVSFLKQQGNPADGIGTDALAANQELWWTAKEGVVGTQWFIDNVAVVEHLTKALDTLWTQIDQADLKGYGDRKVEARRKLLATRVANLRWRITDAACVTEDTHVRFFERDDKGYMLVSVPLHIGSFLRANLWERVITDRNGEREAPVTGVLISATMSVNNDFSFIIDRLSLGTPRTLNVGTPFDYTKQALLYVPNRNMPDPARDRTAWMTTSSMQIQSLIQASGGGALLLFTSREAMLTSYNNLGPTIRSMGFNIYMQGDGTNREIAAKFKADEHSVLFALKSFFTGVDFAGDTCRLVVMDKLPFPNPSDHVFKARCEKADRDAHRSVSFGELSIPMMTLTLLQGFGRAIRTKSDRAVVAILDPRLESKGYGKKILASMPNAPKTTDLTTVERFYASR